LSTANGTIDPSQHEADGIVPFLASRIRALRRHAVVILYQTAVGAHKRQSGRQRQDPENRCDNFFRLVAQL